MQPDDDRRRAWRFVLAMGVVSLWADLCYEGIRAAVGPYLAELGASATAVGLIAGTGELIGYALRWVVGRAADRSGRYWLLTFIGYGTNLIVAPLLAVVGSWQAVAALVVVERLGKAVRSPAKSALIAAAGDRLGSGRVFGVHTAMDQLGAVAGPLTVAAVVASGGGYRGAFAALTVAALLSVLALGYARRLQPPPAPPPAQTIAWSRRAVRGYLIGVGLIGFGLADWALLAFHQVRLGAWSSATVIAVYAGAMAVEGVVALVVGRLHDRWPGRGALVLAAVAALGAVYPLAAWSRTPALVLVGVGLWAMTTGAVDALAKAGIAERVAAPARATAYGLYYAVFGVAWWLGSLTLGVAYDRAPTVAMAVATTAMIAGAAMLVASARSTSAAHARERSGSAAPTDLP